MNILPIHEFVIGDDGYGHENNQSLENKSFSDVDDDLSIFERMFGNRIAGYIEAGLHAAMDFISLRQERPGFRYYRNIYIGPKKR